MRAKRQCAKLRKSRTSTFRSTSGFGNAAVASVAFTPVRGIDTVIENGVTRVISTRHHCITRMKEYETKSLEELRLEDYTAGRNAGQSSGVFGVTGAQTSRFGGAVSNAVTTNDACGEITSGSGQFSKSLTGFEGAINPAASTFVFNNTTINVFNVQTKSIGATSPCSTSNVANTKNIVFYFGASMRSFRRSSTTSTGLGQASQANTSGLFGAKPVETMDSDTTSDLALGQTTATSPNATPNIDKSLFDDNSEPAEQTTAFSSDEMPWSNPEERNNSIAIQQIANLVKQFTIDLFCNPSMVLLHMISIIWSMFVILVSIKRRQQ